MLATEAIFTARNPLVQNISNAACLQTPSRAQKLFTDSGENAPRVHRFHEMKDINGNLC